jgi:hypothetical protein
MAKQNHLIEAYKKPVVRSVAYPAFTLEYAIEFTKNIYLNFGTSGFNSRETIAAVLKKSAEYLKSPISTCVQYGLLDMKSKVGYKPSELFMSIYKQLDEEVLRSAMIECLKGPKLYSILIEKYKGNIVPSLTALSTNLFKNHDIAENTSEKAASVFLENLKFLDLISRDNTLIDLEKSTEESPVIMPLETLESPILQSNDRKNHNLDDNMKGFDTLSSFIVEVPLGENRKAKVLCPIDVNNRDWKKIIKVLNSYIDDDL